MADLYFYEGKIAGSGTEMNKQSSPRILSCALESYRNVIRSIHNNYYTFYLEFYYTHTLSLIIRSSNRNHEAIPLMREKGQLTIVAVGT